MNGPVAIRARAELSRSPTAAAWHEQMTLPGRIVPDAADALAAQIALAAPWMSLAALAPALLLQVQAAVQVPAAVCDRTKTPPHR